MSLSQSPSRSASSAARVKPAVVPPLPTAAGTLIEYAPRKKLETYFTSGWWLVPGHKHDSRDYAILVVKQDCAGPADLIQTWMQRFAPPVRERLSTREQGYRYLQQIHAARRRQWDDTAKRLLARQMEAV